MDLFNSRLK